MGEGAKLSKGFFMRSVLSKEKYWWQRLPEKAAVMAIFKTYDKRGDPDMIENKGKSQQPNCPHLPPQTYIFIYGILQAVRFMRV